jgi:hypothetical protein
MMIWSVAKDVGLGFGAMLLVLWALWRLVQWARARSRRAYVVGALFAPFMGLGSIVDPDFRIVNEAKRQKKREEDEPGDPPADDVETPQ